jgi:hypothetical protein
MGERKDCKELEKIISGSQSSNNQLLELKNTAEKIKTTSMQYTISENKVKFKRETLMQQIKLHEESVTNSKNLRFNNKTNLNQQRRFAMAWIFIAVSLLSLGGVGTVYASNAALPGDVLYPVKIASEDIQLFFSDEEGDVGLLLDFMDERLQEIEIMKEDNNLEGIDLALESYQNQMEQMTNLMAKVKPDDPVAGNALQAEVQNRLEEQAQRMLNINEETGDQLQIQEQNQERTETQDQLKSGNDDLNTEEIENGNQNGTGKEQDNGQQGEQKNQQQTSTQFSASLQAYELTQDGQFVLRFAVNGTQAGDVLVYVNGIEYACSSSQSSLICQGPVPTDENVQVKVIDSISGSSLFNQWVSISLENSSSTPNGNNNGQGGSGGKQH